jgi:hypothetical protein
LISSHIASISLNNSLGFLVIDFLSVILSPFYAEQGDQPEPDLSAIGCIRSLGMGLFAISYHPNPAKCAPISTRLLSPFSLRDFN